MEHELRSWAAQTPKCELHRHLEGAIPYTTLMRLQAEGHIKPNPPWGSVEDCRSAIVFHEPADDLDSVLAHFDLFQQCFVSTKVTQEITRDVILYAVKAESIDLLELRFAPVFMAEKHGLDPREVMAAVVRGRAEALAQCPAGTRVGLIVIHSRHHGSIMAVEVAKLAAAFRSDIVGFDFAGSEAAFPPVRFPCTRGTGISLPLSLSNLKLFINHLQELFVDAARVLHAAAIPLTVHCGEGTPPDYIQRTLDLLRPRRLGHALSLVADDELVRAVRDSQGPNRICVECCPTSNLITNGVQSYAQHPVKALLRSGVAVTVNSDDPTLWCDLTDEWVHCIRDIGMTREELLRMDQIARESTFCV